MEPDKDKLSWYWMLRWLAGSLIVVGNLTVIYVISTRKGLQKTTNWFVFSLACSDLGVGGIIVPASYICTFKIKCELEILHVCYNILLYVSVWNLCVLTVDRYIAVVYSLSYSSIMTHSRMKFLLSFTWGLPIITSFIPLTFKLVEGNNRSGNTEKIFRVVVLFAFEILPCLLMILSYIHILIICRRHSRAIQHQEAQLGHNYHGSWHHDSREWIKEKSAFLAVLVVVSLFILCWTISAYRAMCDNFDISQVNVQTIKVSRLLFLINAAIDPFVWALMKRDICRELVLCIRCLKNDNAYVGRPYSVSISSVLSYQNNNSSAVFVSASSRTKGDAVLGTENETYDTVL